MANASLMVGVEKKDFETIAKTAINHGPAIVNPVEVIFEGLLDILNKVY